MKNMIANFNEDDEALISRRKAIFEDASLDAPALAYDAGAYLLGISGVLGILATHSAFAAGIFTPALLWAVTPVSTVLAVSEFGVREAQKLRTAIADAIEKQPEKFNDNQLIAMAHAINTTFVSPLWPFKLRLKKAQVERLRSNFAQLFVSESPAEIGRIVAEIKPVVFRWEPLNDDFTLKHHFENQEKRILDGYRERKELKQKRDIPPACALEP